MMVDARDQAGIVVWGRDTWPQMAGSSSHRVSPVACAGWCHRSGGVSLSSPRAASSSGCLGLVSALSWGLVSKRLPLTCREQECTHSYVRKSRQSPRLQMLCHRSV